MSATYDAIQAGNANFMAAFQRGDAAGVAACYTADGQLLPPGSTPLSGTANITAFWQGAMSLGIKSAQLATQSIEERGDLAVEVGQYTLDIQPDGTAAMTDIGKYVVVWKNDGGTWKLHVDIWNTNNPA
ncbi:MAG: SgcJ/EcaC family oxidoreductase [Acidobacteria bacterium]|nr:SgcJ/EcaC family oxidoreductase [Acidobacteriota bacterium]